MKAVIHDYPLQHTAPYCNTLGTKQLHQARGIRAIRPGHVKRGKKKNPKEKIFWFFERTGLLPGTCHILTWFEIG